MNFDPTYKYDDHSDVYDTSEKRRAPAWCDRILYETIPNNNPNKKLTLVDYGRRESKLSDHRPVTGTFEVLVCKVNKTKKVEIEQKLLDQLFGTSPSAAKSSQGPPAEQ